MGLDKTWHGQQNRTGAGRAVIRQCRARQDKIEPGWVDHGRTGSVGRNWACSCKADHVRAEQCRAGQRQAEPGRNRAASVSTRRGREGPGRATKGRPVLKRAGQNVTGSGIVRRTGQGWREGSIGQCRARQDSARPVWVRIDCRRLGQERAKPGRAG